MAGSLETERIKHLPIPRNHKDLASLERKRKKYKKVLREKNSPREIKMKKVKKETVVFILLALKKLTQLSLLKAESHLM